MNLDPYQPDPRTQAVHSARSAPRPVAGPDPSPFAVHGDPTRRGQSPEADVERRSRRVMWIRPTDLPTQLANSRQVLAGIDLHAALVSKLWRQPAKALEAARRSADRSAGPTALDAPAKPIPRTSRRAYNEEMDRP